MPRRRHPVPKPIVPPAATGASPGRQFRTSARKNDPRWLPQSRRKTPATPRDVQWELITRSHPSSTPSDPVNVRLDSGASAVHELEHEYAATHNAFLLWAAFREHSLDRPLSVWIATPLLVRSQGGRVR